MKSILAIDDKKNNLITISALINDNMPDYKVFVALSGLEGIEIAQKEQPDTILLDIIMPEMDGFETCKRLKENDLTKHIPVVLITAIKIDTESRIEGLNIGADAFLSKPIDPSEFIAQVKVMLRIKDAEDKLRAEKEILENLVAKRTKEISEKNKELQDEITERKRTEEEIEKLSRRNQLILDTTLDGYVLTEPKGKIIDVNPAYCKMIGYKREEILCMNMADLDVEMQNRKMPEQINQLMKFGNSRTETKHRCKNGAQLNMDMSISLMHVNGKPMVVAFIRDITKQKYAQKIQRVLLNISNAAIINDDLIKLISHIKAELGTIIDTKNFYIALYDNKTDTLSLPFFEDEKDRLTAMPAGKTLTYYVIKTQKPLLATKARIKQLEDAGEVAKFGSDSEVWLGVPLKKNTEVIGVLAVQSYQDEFAYDESDLEILEFISEQISISLDRKNAEQDLKDALKKATESDKLKSVFLSTMSHELRTPLNAVIGFSEIIRNEDLPAKEIQELNKSINISGNNLLNIVEDIFEITLIETGELQLVKQKIDLLSMLNEVHELIQVEQQNTDKKHIDLILSIPNDFKGLDIITDPVKFKQILINLLKNALKFTFKGKVQYGFNIKQNDNNSYLEFFVKDTGIGIPKKKKEFIFEMFRQIEESYSRKYGGIGIGLTIAKKLTELLGGNLWLDTANKNGSIFYFTIPIEEPLGSNKGQKRRPKNEIKNSKDNILIVEDDFLSSNFLKIVLEKSGFNTLCAKNGEEALLSCKNNSDIKLVLMDINMPIMDGYEATKKIKEIWPDLPIIAQTAYAIEGEREKLLEAGCNDYISKPINKRILLEKISKYMAK